MGEVFGFPRPQKELTDEEVKSEILLRASNLENQVRYPVYRFLANTSGHGLGRITRTRSGGTRTFWWEILEDLKLPWSPHPNCSTINSIVLSIFILSEQLYTFESYNLGNFYYKKIIHGFTDSTWQFLVAYQKYSLQVFPMDGVRLYSYLSGKLMILKYHLL